MKKQYISNCAWIQTNLHYSNLLIELKFTQYAKNKAQIPYQPHQSSSKQNKADALKRCVDPLVVIDVNWNHRKVVCLIAILIAHHHFPHTSHSHFHSKIFPSTLFEWMQKYCLCSIWFHKQLGFWHVDAVCHPISFDIYTKEKNPNENCWLIVLI